MDNGYKTSLSEYTMFNTSTSSRWGTSDYKLLCV